MAAGSHNVTLWTDLCPHSVINTRAHTVFLGCSAAFNSTSGCDCVTHLNISFKRLHVSMVIKQILFWHFPGEGDVNVLLRADPAKIFIAEKQSKDMQQHCPERRLTSAKPDLFFPRPVWILAHFLSAIVPISISATFLQL